MAAMFSRKPAYAASPPPPEASGDLRARLMAAVSNPYIAASGAACLFMVTLAGLVLVTGDPKAGAPIIRVELTKIGATKNAPEGWKEALADEGEHEAPFKPDTFDLSAKPIVDSPVEASISFPGETAPGEEAPGMVHAAGGALPQAPIAGLTVPGPGGAPLPIIAANGRSAAEAYARPFTATGRPKVSVVIGGLGLNPQTTRAAIETLPPEVTLSFAPYAEGLQGWIDLARANGHEVLLETPMEPADYPANDPGPYTLIAGNRPEDTVRKLEWLMSRATGYFGLSNYLGARFIDSDAAMNTFNTALKARGLAFVDDGLAARRGGSIPRASADRVIDDELSASAIDAQLRALETGASARGQSMGSGFAYPVTINQVRTWANGLSARGIQLAPASALTRR
ncbi:divergent polysaccharide deacetylase family protein [Caulobacter sp. ErkDOM-YI]|uniref:divergent polysaccharide deacetylase family protein n=1 Tax=unclassified Caulobacter TaxID=2648921 RepID=UPI003AF40B64